MTDKLENHALLFRILLDAEDWYAFRIIPYLNLSINNLEKKGNIHELVMKILKYMLKTRRNITGDRLYSVVDTMEKLYQNKATYVRRIIPNSKGLPVSLKNAKKGKVLSSKFILKNIIVQWWCYQIAQNEIRIFY